jgi:hypothetical protein
MTLSARISPDHDLFFTTTGLGHDDELSDAPGSRDAQKFTRWRLAGSDQLLLPGQGYALIILPRA